MKKIYIIVFIAISNLCFAQGTWTQKANFPSVGRELPIGFSIGTKGYVGTGGGGSGYFNDFWEYDPLTNVWTQKANLAGTGRYGAVGFSIGNYGYIATGKNWNTNQTFNDLWEYDPVANTWTQKANYGGGGRAFATGFSIGSKGYIVSGTDSSFATRGDVWEWNQSTNIWTLKDSIPVPRYVAVGFSINTKGYVSTGDGGGSLNDMWEFDPVANTWTQKANLPAIARVDATGFSLCGKGYVGTKGECPCLSDFWLFDPVLNTWTQKANIPGPAMDDACAFIIGNKGYIALGDASSLLNTLYEYTPDSNNLCSQCALAANFISNDTAFCSEVGQCISFTDLSTCNPTSWHWLFFGATPDTSTQQNPTNICYYTPGTYPVTLIVTDSTGNSDTLAVNPLIIFANLPPPPTINVIGSDTLISSHGSYYQWYLNGSPIGGATDSFYVAQQGGTYSVQITDNLGCNSLSGGVFITGLSPVSFGETFVVHLYPNPVSDEMIISFDSPLTKDIEIAISDMVGQEIERKTLEKSIPNTREYSLSMKELSNGLYVLRIAPYGIVRKFLVMHK